VSVLVRADGVANPPPPEDPVLSALAEGPMRRELRRQIARLEREVTRLKAIVGPWEMDRVTRPRGPALLGADSLERIRDELLTAHRHLQRRLDPTHR
jgi:hypothetical protein